jgi:hypothetical protein
VNVQQLMLEGSTTWSKLIPFYIKVRPEKNKNKRSLLQMHRAPPSNWNASLPHGDSAGTGRSPS